MHTEHCPKHGAYEYYGSIIPPCPTCGYPQAYEKVEDYLDSMGVSYDRP
jgi:uncharacterized Zn finger protein (UPF0148 family)